MRIAEEAPGRLVLHESPWGVRAAGVLLAALGAGVLLMVVAGGHGGGPARAATCGWRTSWAARSWRAGLPPR